MADELKAAKYVVSVKFTEQGHVITYHYSAETLKTSLEVLNNFASEYADQGSASFREGDMISVTMMTIAEWNVIDQTSNPMIGEYLMPAEDCGFGESTPIEAVI